MARNRMNNSPDQTHENIGAPPWQGVGCYQPPELVAALVAPSWWGTVSGGMLGWPATPSWRGTPSGGTLRPVSATRSGGTLSGGRSGCN